MIQKGTMNPLQDFLRDPNQATAAALKTLFPDYLGDWQDVPFIVENANPEAAAQHSLSFLDTKKQGRKRWDFPMYLGTKTRSIREVLAASPAEGWVCPLDGGDLDDSIAGQLFDARGVDWAPVMPQIGNGRAAGVAWALRGEGRRTVGNAVPQDLKSNPYRMVQDLTAPNLLPWVRMVLDAYDRLPPHEQQKVVADLLRPGAQSQVVEKPAPAAAVLGAPENVSRSYVRKLIDQKLATNSELEAFCIDHVPEVYKQFSNGMDRHARVTLLLAKVTDLDWLAEALRNTDY